VKTHVFCGRRWAIRNQTKLAPGDLGACDYDEKTLHAPIEGDTEHELDVVIHEALRACCRRLCEEEVDKAATSIARFLWRLGWRKDIG